MHLRSREEPREVWMAGAARAFVIAAIATVCVVVLYLVFVRTHDGQEFDALLGRNSRQPTAERDRLTRILTDVTFGAVTLTAVSCGVVTIIRRRWTQAAAALVILAGATGTTELLKHVVLTRPRLGFGPLNSYPSGHTTVSASLVFATLLVVPITSRWLVQLVGSVAVGVIGTGTVVAGWHLPSDVVAAFVVTLAWGAVVLAFISLAGVPGAVRQPSSHPVALFAGLVVAAAFFVALGVRPHRSVTDLTFLAVTMTGLAVVGALAIGVFARLVDARVP